jgi:hypothetical protein
MRYRHHDESTPVGRRLRDGGGDTLDTGANFNLTLSSGTQRRGEAMAKDGHCHVHLCFVRISGRGGGGGSADRDGAGFVSRTWWADVSGMSGCCMTSAEDVRVF